MNEIKARRLLSKLATKLAFSCDETVLLTRDEFMDVIETLADCLKLEVSDGAHQE